MCGIAGYIGDNPPDDGRVRETLVRMHHRGPDHQAFARYRLGDKHVVLLHTRLAIIDLDEKANQPFESMHCSLVYNGEIYNYVELRDELRRRNVALKTKSDTEVVIESYLQDGEDCVDSFEGMWSFALLDRKESKLILSRDRFGEKPLYYCQADDGFYFASELAHIFALTGRKFPVNRDYLLKYVAGGYRLLNGSDESWFTGIRKLPGAHQMTITPDLSVKTRRYWTLTPEIDRAMKEEDAVDTLRGLLFDSMRFRLRSDVPLAVSLSGGVDSGTIASIAAKRCGANLRCFSIVDDDPRYDEREFIQATAEDLGADLTMIPLCHEGNVERLEQLIAERCAPIATSTYFVNTLVTEEVAKAGIKVVFSGVGADEILTGYYDHFLLHFADLAGTDDLRAARSAWETHVRPVVRNPDLQNPDLFVDNPDYRDHLLSDVAVAKDVLNWELGLSWSEERWTNQSLLRNRMINELFREVTPVILNEEDLNSMRVSVENRAPFLDRRIAEFAVNVPPRLLISNGYGKSLLRKATEGILNDHVRLERQKRGFNASVETLFDLGDPDAVERLADSGGLLDDVVDQAELKSIIANRQFGNGVSKLLFALFNANAFLRAHG